MSKSDVTPALLADLKEKAQKATPGSWYRNGIQIQTANQIPIAASLYCPGKHDAAMTAANDAAFIAAASPDVVLALIERIEKQEKEAGWLASQLSKCETDCEYCLPFCPYELGKQPAFCDYDEKHAYDASCDGEMPCTHRIDICWREAARLAMENTLS